MGALDLGRYNLPSPVGLASTCEACVALSWARRNMNRIVGEANGRHGIETSWITAVHLDRLEIEWQKALCMNWRLGD